MNVVQSHLKPHRWGSMAGVDPDDGPFSSEKGNDDEKAVIWHVIRVNGVWSQYRLGGRVAGERAGKLVRGGKFRYRNAQHYLSSCHWRL